MPFDIQPFQTLIAAVFGFSGVILTLWYNASNQRRQDRERLRLEKHACTMALLTELRVVLQSITENLAQSPPGCDHDVAVPLDWSNGKIFNALIGKLPIVNSDALEKTIQAHIVLQEFGSKLFLIGATPIAGTNMLSVPGQRHRILMKMYEQMGIAVTTAINSLEEAERRLEK